jgi:hypothetical protein
MNGRSRLTVEFDARPRLAVRLLGGRRLRLMIRSARPHSHLALRHVIEQFAATYGYRVIEFDATVVDDVPDRVACSEIVVHLRRQIEVVDRTT